uniref:Uncharacterized protein n=1 Tax=Caenorhabditis japonica TaxID=281687 RepID=A0A8R1EPK0_CAEJA
MNSRSVVSRCFSTISAQFSEEELQAIFELKQKSEKKLTKGEQNVMKNREWARAPLVEVRGKLPTASWNRTSKYGKRLSNSEDVEQPVVNIRWAEKPERDVNILLSDAETLYSVEVKSVLYGIIQSISFQELKVRMRNPNTVVVKVANDQYAAHKEAARFSLIRRVVNGKELKSQENQLKVKLTRIDENEKGIRRFTNENLTENEFFEKYEKSITILKNYKEV